MIQSITLPKPLGDAVSSSLARFNGFGSLLAVDELREFAGRLNPAELRAIELQGLLEIGRMMEQGIGMVSEELRTLKAPPQIADQALIAAEHAAVRIIDKFKGAIDPLSGALYVMQAEEQAHCNATHVLISQRRAEAFLESIKKNGYGQREGHQHRLQKLCVEAAAAFERYRAASDAAGAA